jgi:hypothetical protein
MRWVNVCSLLAALGACAGAGPSQQRTIPNLADGPGCLGVKAEICLRWLRSTLTLREGFISESMGRRQPVDVNGRPLRGLMTLLGTLPGRFEPLLIIIRLNPDDTVASIESNLFADIVQAHTEDGFDRSGVYEVVTRLLGRRCAPLAKLDLYRFLENSLKPRLKTDVSRGLSGLHRQTVRAADIPYAADCGVRFTYTNFYEWRGSAALKGAAKVPGYSSIELK